MAAGLQQLYKAEVNEHGSKRENGNTLVDIVAVHGLNENLIGAWTDPHTGVLWLRDLLPQAIKVARVLTFGYDASASSFFGESCADKIQAHAHTLIAGLQADRSLEGCDHRPIVFVCHGLGGILVKKALAYSSSRTSSLVSHYYTIFVSTYAILFFGTPHNSIDRKHWLELESIQAKESRQVLQTQNQSQVVGERDSETLRQITDSFAPLMKQFHIFFFWEEIQCHFMNRSDFVVQQSSAAPIVDDTERSGIHATHFGMVKFPTADTSSYRTVIAALLRYCREAPAKIARRWEQALFALSRARSNEASELMAIVFDTHDDREGYYKSRLPCAGERRFNEHFYPPQEKTPDFIGRDDVSRVLEDALFALDSPGSYFKQKRFVVYGMGGSGKTQFCSKFARDHQERFWGVFTIHATSVETVKDSFAKLGMLSGLEATESSGKYWLSSLKKPWLLIIDNADNPGLDLPSMFPMADRGYILVTTRNPDFRRHATTGSVELKGLKQEEALHLLLKRADVPRPWDPSTETAGNEITKALGYLALAVIQAGTSIFRKICDLKDYLSFHKQYRNRYRAMPRFRDAFKNEDDIVYSAFDFSLKYLQTKDSVASRDAVDILNLVSFYHFEHIRVDIFTKAVENRLKSLGPSANNSIAIRLLEPVIARLRPPRALPDFLKQGPDMLSPYRVRQALYELYSLSLISYDGKSASFSLHPLVHAWAQDHLGPGEKNLWAQIALNTLTESVLLPPDDDGEGHGEFRRDLLPHMDACLAACPIRLPDYRTGMARLQILSAVFFQQTLLLIIRDQALNAGKCGYVYADRGRFEEATTYLSMVKDVLIQILGHRNEKTMEAMLGLAATYWGLGRLEEAIDLQKCVVEARTKVLSPDHCKTLMAMDQLGRSYWLHGQYTEALSLQQLTFERMKVVLGPDDDRTLAAWDNLGVTLGSWHRYDESVHIHQQVLRIREERLGPNDLQTITTMSNLAMALLDLGKTNEAHIMMDMVYEERKLKLGKEHPWTLWALCYLAKIKCKMGSLQEAEGILLDGIEAGKRSLSENHLGVLMGRGQLARVYFEQGRLDEAEKITLDTVARLEESRGMEHPDCIYALWKLSRLYRRQNRVEKAIETCEIGLQRANTRLTSQHPSYEILQSDLQCLRNLKQDNVPKDAIHSET